MSPARAEYRLTRFIFLRAISFIYTIGFLILLRQGIPLLGENGLLPFSRFIQSVGRAIPNGITAFFRLPTVFWMVSPTDGHFNLFALLGLIGGLVSLLGFSSSVLFAFLWFTYLSFVNIGQIFYGYGWETLLLECGFLAIFLSPLLNLGPLFDRRNRLGQEGFAEAPIQIIWLLRWVLFRLMFGAGLIKLRGDPCWLDLSCMQYHYETQPVPNPLSWYFHHLPAFVQSASVLFTHIVEIIVPFGVFGPRRIRHISGVLFFIFQSLLILSGNLSWLNYMTIVLTVSCFDDSFWRFLQNVGSRIGGKSDLEAVPADRSTQRKQTNRPSPLIPKAHRALIFALTALILVLSINPTINLFSPRQMMNASFDSFHLVNTYGAFGSVTKQRREIILLGTRDSVITPSTQWLEYEFNCKPGDPARLPCVMSPYHFRLDWQMWFAAMSDRAEEDWFFALVEKLLEGNQKVLSLLARNPFPEKPPAHIKADLYEYHFSGERGRWWDRVFISTYLPVVSKSLTAP